MSPGESAGERLMDRFKRLGCDEEGAKKAFLACPIIYSLDLDTRLKNLQQLLVEEYGVPEVRYIPCRSSKERPRSNGFRTVCSQLFGKIHGS